MEKKSSYFIRYLDFLSDLPKSIYFLSEGEYMIGFES